MMKVKPWKLQSQTNKLYIYIEIREIVGVPQYLKKKI